MSSSFHSLLGEYSVTSDWFSTDHLDANNAHTNTLETKNLQADVSGIGNLTIANNLRIPNNARDGAVLTSDAMGNSSWKFVDIDDTYRYRGEWNSTTAYRTNNQVKWNGRLWVCMSDHKDREPKLTNNVFWFIVVSGAEILEPRVDINESNISSMQGALGQHDVKLDSLQEKVDKIPVYPPITMKTAVEFYGDSITAGAGVSTSRRYTNLLCSQHGWTQHNHAVSGGTMRDCINALFRNHRDNRDAMVNIGFNDVRDTLCLDSEWNQYEDSMMAILMHLVMPSSRWVNAQGDSRMTKTPNTWKQANYSGIGGYFESETGTATATVSGRYVGFSLTISNTVDAIVSVTVDGTKVANQTKIGRSKHTSNLGQRHIAWNFTYDTGSDTNHTVLLEFGSNSAVLLYIFGFNRGDLTNTALVISPDSYNYENDKLHSQGESYRFNGGSLQRLDTVRRMQQVCCERLRALYSAKTYYVEASTNNPKDNKQNDLIHPNNQGNEYIRDRVNYVLANGDYLTDSAISTMSGTPTFQGLTVTGITNLGRTVMDGALTVTGNIHGARYIRSHGFTSPDGAGAYMGFGTTAMPGASCLMNQPGSDPGGFRWIMYNNNNTWVSDPMTLTRDGLLTTAGAVNSVGVNSSRGIAVNGWPTSTAINHSFIGRNRAGATGRMSFGCNRGGGVGGFDWVSYNSTGAEESTPMILSREGDLTVERNATIKGNLTVDGTITGANLVHTTQTLTGSWAGASLVQADIKAVRFGPMVVVTFGGASIPLNSSSILLIYTQSLPVTYRPTFPGGARMMIQFENESIRNAFLHILQDGTIIIMSPNTTWNTGSAAVLMAGTTVTFMV